MEEIFSYLLKSAGVLSIFVLIYHFLLRRLTFFQANRWFLLFGMLASIAFPLIEITQTVYVEQPEMEVLPQQLMTPMAYALQEPVAEPLINVSQMLLLLYASISLFFLGKMTVELLSLRRLIHSGKASREDGFMRISLPRKVTPFSFFNYICFYEKEENNPANDLILKHEQVHAREWHSVDLLLTHIYCAVFWINPLAWWLKRQIGENLEFIADATAKVENTTGISYERTLLSSAASHMQPALANNFFTPFIKKRIQMLQKETSKTWNAYKYALILPVIVLFLYSFNTVTKTEYIKSKLETSQSSEEPLVFDITAATSQQELDHFVDMINDYADFKMDLKMETSDSGNKVFKVYTAFGDKKLFNNFSMELAEGKLLLLEVLKDQARINDTDMSETITITAKGTTTTAISDILYTEDDGTNNVTRSEVSKIRFTIPSTTTKESLERIKKTLKTEYDVDFSYGNLKYKDGKIVSISITLDDNRGFKGSQNYNNNVTIPTICIVGDIEENNKSWSLGNCDDNGLSFNGSNKSINNILSSIQDLNLTEMKVKLSETEIDSMQFNLKRLQTDLSMFQDDEINLQLKARLAEAQRRLNLMNMDSMQRVLRNSSIKLRSDLRRLKKDSMIFGDPNVTYSLGKGSFMDVDSVIYDLDASEPQLYRNRFSDSKGPLFILDGVEVKEDVFKKMNPNKIASVSVLKDKSATSLYGDKGKNGVVIITTKTGAKKKNPPLYFIDGKETSENDFENMDVYRFKSVSVLKDDQAILKYGNRAKNGVIKVELKTDAEMKKQLVNSNDFEEVIVNGYSTATSTSIDTFTITIDDFTDTELAELKSTLKNLDHDFELKTLRKNGEKVSKLKFDLDGTTYTYQPKNGIKSLTIKKEGKGEDPKVSAVTY